MEKKHEKKHETRHEKPAASVQKAVVAEVKKTVVPELKKPAVVEKKHDKHQGKKAAAPVVQAKKFDKTQKHGNKHHKHDNEDKPEVAKSVTRGDAKSDKSKPIKKSKK